MKGVIQLGKKKNWALMLPVRYGQLKFKKMYAQMLLRVKISVTLSTNIMIQKQKTGGSINNQKNQIYTNIFVLTPSNIAALIYIMVQIAPLVKVFQIMFAVIMANVKELVPGKEMENAPVMQVIQVKHVVLAQKLTMKLTKMIIKYYVQSVIFPVMALAPKLVQLVRNICV